MSNGYYSSPEHALANLFVGRSWGITEGFADGLENGFERGKVVGFRKGYDRGWNDAVAGGNKTLDKQKEHTYKCAEQRDEAYQRINEMQDYINRQYTELVQLKQEKEQLQQENQALQEQAKKEVTDYNRLMAFSNTARNVMAELLENTPSSVIKQMRHAFKEHYTRLMAKNLKKGSMEIPLDADPTFAETLPKTHRFIVDMLNAPLDQTEKAGHSRSD